MTIRAASSTDAPADGSVPLTHRPRARTRLRRLVVGVTVAAGLVAGGLPASATVYNGNICNSARWYEQTVGGAACVYLNVRTASSITLQLGALDAVQDGLSIRNNTRVDQYNAAGSYLGSSSLAVANSAGAITTNVGGSIAVPRRAGAAIFRIVLSATRFNAPNGVVYNTDSYSWGYYW